MKKIFSSLLIIYIILLISLLASCSMGPCEHKNTEWRLIKEATFLAEGECELVCLKCDEVVEKETLSRLLCPHAPKAWVTRKEATYDADGMKELFCSDCERVFESEVIPMLICDHKDAKWVEDTTRRFECGTCKKTLLSYDISEKGGMSADEVKELLKNSVVKVYCYGYDGKKIISEGSGFFIDNEGTFVTNAHVVKNAYFVKISTHSGTFYDVNLMYSYDNKGSDHAICKAENCVSVPVTFEADYSVGDKIFALGYPGEQAELVVTEGVILGEEKIVKDAKYIPNSAVIIDGNSGGILVNDKGTVLGITTGYTPPDEYLALSFDEFYADLFAEREDKTLFSYFHTKREIALSFDNFDDVFELVDTDGKAHVKLKTRLLNEKVATPDKATVFVTLADGTVTKVVFEAESEMKAGVILDVPAAEAEMSTAEGTVIFYNTFLEI